MDPRLHQPTIASNAQSIRELGEMLTVAEQHDDFRGRLEELERLTDLVADRVASVRNLVSAEYLEVMSNG
jgi:MoxR-like ATPase